MTPMPTSRPVSSAPLWEYGGTFRAAYDGTRRLCNPETASPELYEIADSILCLMDHAHVATMDLQQFMALPDEMSDLDDELADPHLPFSPYYVSIGHPLYAGMLFMHSETQLGVVPFWDMNDAKDWEGPRLAVPISVINVSTKGYNDLFEKILGPDKTFSEEEQQDRNLQRLRAILYSCKLVRFLQSANVDVEDAPVSRQVRRAAARKGAQIAQRVYVRSPRHRRTESGASEHHLDFSHRFEVRGHYKHYGPDTRLFRATERDRPHKIIQHSTRGRVVRIWCPDFVKGPEDKPLVPKARVYKGEE